MQDVLGKYNLIETLAKETNSSLHNIQDAHSYFALDLGIFFNFYLAGRDDTFWAFWESTTTVSKVHSVIVISS